MIMKYRRRFIYFKLFIWNTDLEEYRFICESSILNVTKLFSKCIISNLNRGFTNRKLSNY